MLNSQQHQPLGSSKPKHVFGILSSISLHDDYFSPTRFTSIESNEQLRGIERATQLTSTMSHLPFISEELVPLSHARVSIFIIGWIMEMEGDFLFLEKSQKSQKWNVDKKLEFLNRLAQTVQCHHPVYDDAHYILQKSCHLSLSKIDDSLLVFRRNVHLNSSSLFVLSRQFKKDLSIVVKLVRLAEKSDKFFSVLLHPKTVVMFPWLPYAMGQAAKLSAATAKIVSRRFGLSPSFFTMPTKLFNGMAVGLVLGLGHVITVCTVIEALVQVYSYYQTRGNLRFQSMEACDFDMYHVIMDDDDDDDSDNGEKKKKQKKNRRGFYRESEWMAIDVKKPICIDLDSSGSGGDNGDGNSDDGDDGMAIVEVVDGDYDPEIELPDIPVSLLSARVADLTD